MPILDMLSYRLSRDASRFTDIGERIYDLDASNYPGFHIYGGAHHRGMLIVDSSSDTSSDPQSHGDVPADGDRNS